MSFEQEERKLAKRRQYSTDEKFAALEALDRNGGKLYATAKVLGINSQTLGQWAKARREGRLEQSNGLPELPTVSHPLAPIDENAPLDDQLEQVARQMVTVMPEKVEEASLQELTRSLSIVLATMKEARAGKDEEDSEEDVYEKLHKLMAHLAAAGIPGTGIPTTVEDSEAAARE